MNAFLYVSNSFAAGIYCHSNGKLIDTLSTEGHFDCLDAFRDGSVCFLGNRSEAVKLFKDLQDTNYNWDEEWIEDIHLKGKSEISYEYVDGPNEIRQEFSMKVCR